MARNIEIKSAVPDLGTVRRAALSLTSTPPETISQIDTFFVVPRGRLKVRQFADGSGELISYTRPDQSGPKLSSYSIVPSDDAGALVEILAKLAPIRGRVVKSRELFLVGRTRVHLDQVEMLGSFVELEVVLRDGESAESGMREAVSLMERLGIAADALIPDAYVDLLERLTTY